MYKSLIAAAVAGGVLVVASIAQDTAPPADKPHPASHPPMSHAHMAKEMRVMNEKMVAALGTADAEYEKRFIDMMIPHHQGAVLMAKDALQKATKPELKEMAKKMIQEQEKEIAMLKEYRSQWYGGH